MGENWARVNLTSKESILPFLETDRLYAAYAVGDLEPDLFAQCAWAGAEKAGRLRALGLHFSGLEPPAFFLMGEPEGVRFLLQERPNPPHAYLTCREEHLPAVRGRYRWEEKPIPMWRMVLRKKDLPPPPQSCVRLTAEHAGQIRALVSLGGIGGFAPDQIGRGIFYGVLKEERLLSVAGTHLVSVSYGVAAIGNVATDPEYRGRGLGNSVVGAVAGDLRKLGVRDIVLNVRQNNAPALHLYEKLGFERHCGFLEGPAFLREDAVRRGDAHAKPKSPSDRNRRRGAGRGK